MRHFTCLRHTNRRCLNGAISSCTGRNWSQAAEKQRRASDLSTRRSHLLIHNKSFHSSDLHSSYRSKFDDNKIVGACSFPNERRVRDIDPWSLAQWIWKQAKIPKGFENFFPKNRNNERPNPKVDKTNPSGLDNDTSTDKESKGEPISKKINDNIFKHFQDNNAKGKKKEGFGYNKSNGGNEDNQAGLAVMLLLVLAVRHFLDEENNSKGREITWADFYNDLLEPGDVDRIVIINKKTARVYLRPGSSGVPSTKLQSGAITGLPTKDIRRSKRSGMDDGNPSWDNETVMEMGLGQSESSQTEYSETNFGEEKQNNQQPHQLVYHFNIGSVESFEEKLTRAQHDLNIPLRDFVPVQYANETNWIVELIKTTPALLMIGVTAYMLRGMTGMGGKGGGGGGIGGIFQVGKSNAKKVSKEDVNVTFADVAGCQEAKKEIMEFVDFLQDATRFTKLGAKIPKGALLCGPPGTGKTLLAKAVAGEAGVPFYSISGSDFIEMFVGVGPSRVRDLFKEARKNAPCIIFIDEIDAVGRKRGRGGFSGGNDERENTLNQLLVEMDGFNPSSGVVVLAGTNRADILDNALVRPGRFDRQIQVDKPDVKGRQEVFKVHLKGITLDAPSDEIAGRLAGLTPGFTGADIANICNEAAIVAARRAAESVSIDDFEKATDRIIGGLESNKIMSVEEREVVAYHEAGHAVAGWFLEHADPLLKVTIIPRSSGALGYAQYLPKEVFLRTQEQIMHIVCMALAGRAAEEVFFGKVTTGASDDLRRVTEIVYSTIQLYGMNERVGQLAFPKDPNSYGGDKPYSDSTAEAMDDEARQIVDAAYQRTLNLVREKKKEVESVAKLLLEKETITHDDVMDLVGARPFTGNEEYNQYVSNRYVKKDDAQKEESISLGDEAVSLGDEAELTPGLAFKP